MVLLKDLKFNWIQIRKIILLNYQNNYVKLVARILKLLIIFKIPQQNYFDGPTKLFSDLYLSEFLNFSSKSFFPCINYIK